MMADIQFTETSYFPKVLDEVNERRFNRLLDNTQHNIEITDGYNEFDVLLPLQTKKFTVFEVQKLGRILVAKKDFNMGDLVLREKPLLTFSNRADLVSKFKEMNEVEKAELFSMHHLESSDKTMYPSCKKIMNELNEQAKTMYTDIIAKNKINHQSNHDSVTINDTFQCLSVANLNAHSFHPTDPEPDRAAFFPVAAIAAHSCQPNCIYTIGVNFIEFYAIEAIKQGDMITATYLDWNHLSQSNTSQRRIKLMESKDFYCLCSKCRDFDYSNGLICCTNNCSGITYGATRMSVVDTAIANHNKSSNKQSQITTLGATFKGEICHWKCAVCHSTKTPILPIITDIEQEYNDILKNAASSAASLSILTSTNDNNNIEKDNESVIDALEMLVSIVSIQLSPTHYLVTKMLFDLVDMYLSIAYSYESTDYATATEYRYQSVEKLIQLIRINECIDAKCKHVKACHSGNDNSSTATTANTIAISLSNTIHPPSIYNVPYVLKVCIYLNKCHKPLPDWILTYLPLLITFYGDSKTNAHIRNIKRSFGMSSENDDMRDKVSEFCQQS